MLRITIPAVEQYDEVNNEFIPLKEQSLQLEHSLVSISKWEAKWNKPFLTTDEKTIKETIDYIKCMTITQNVDDRIYNGITKPIIDKVLAYIYAPMTATTIRKDNKQSYSREIITSEIIYYKMIAFNIPSEYQKWHLNRLLTLIQVCDIYSSPPKKMSQTDVMMRNAQLNAQRKALLNSKG